MAGERPSRPPEGKELGLSDELWELIRSSFAHEADRRPLVSRFIDFLEEATPDITMLKELTEFDADSEEHLQKLRYMFECGDNTLFGMREDETLTVIEVFDRVRLVHRVLSFANALDSFWFQVLNSSLDDPTLRRRCLDGLQKVSIRRGLVPKSHQIPYSSLAKPEGISPATGRVSITRQWSMDGKLVAVKTISLDYIENFNAFKCVRLSLPKTPLLNAVFIWVLQRLYANGVIWKRLQHPNVVSFLGFVSSSPPISLVYPWMANGNLPNYVREYPNADKLGLVCVCSRGGRRLFLTILTPCRHQLLEVTRGLTYLHRHGLVHGNLTGVSLNILAPRWGGLTTSQHNILVDSDGVAYISEYGLEIVLHDENPSKSIPTNIRWTAPEVLNMEGRRIPFGGGGKAADIYSLAMVMFEVSIPCLYPQIQDCTSSLALRSCRVSPRSPTKATKRSWIGSLQASDPDSHLTRRIGW